eukprot:858003-Amphidinium_carterae.1
MATCPTFVLPSFTDPSNERCNWQGLAVLLFCNVRGRDGPPPFYNTWVACPFGQQPQPGGDSFCGNHQCLTLCPACCQGNMATQPQLP